jgi:hypothetical protein
VISVCSLLTQIIGHRTDESTYPVRGRELVGSSTNLGTPAFAEARVDVAFRDLSMIGPAEIIIPVSRLSSRLPDDLLDPRDMPLGPWRNARIDGSSVERDVGTS